MVGGAAGSSSEVVGRFNVSLNEAREDLGTPASTTISGKVYDGATPAPYVAWALVSAANCTVYGIRVPFCEGGCSNSVCAAENTCQPYPAPRSVGEVTLSGVKTVDGRDTVTLLGKNESYRTGDGTTLAYPAFAEGDLVQLRATGGDGAAFTIEARGISALDVRVSSLTLSKTSAIELRWTGANASVGSAVSANLNLSHHGGSTGYLACEGVADTGALTIPPELVSQLIDLGVAGFPTLTVTRESIGYAATAKGRVALVLSSEFVRTLAVEGFTSCETDAECAPPERCHGEKKLCQQAAP